MKYTHSLFLGSKSLSRQQLLKEAQIPFTTLAQHADETECNWALPLEQVVAQIALYKMDYLIMPSGIHDNDYAFVLTADTLSQDTTGAIQGKPVDYDDAVAKIKSARAGSRLCTAFCLDKKIWRNATWHIETRIQKTVEARYVFDIPDAWIETYLQKSLGLQASNAIAIEGFGGQFLQSVQGSYTTIVGLPMFELRQALQELGFFE